MNTMPCPYCGKGALREKTVPRYQTMLGGIPFYVKDAKIAQCDGCKREVFDAKEIKRWRNDLLAQLQDKGLVVTASHVRGIRTCLGFGVADFAAILGVTRQTVHAWERSEEGGVQLGPAAVLLGLLIDEHRHGKDYILRLLVTAAKERGQKITSPRGSRQVPGPPRGNAPSGIPPRPNCFRATPPGAPRFEKAANAA